MTACAKRRNVLRRQILHLVDEDRHANANVRSKAGHIGQQLQQVDLHVTGIGAAGARRPVDRWRPALDELPAARVGAQSEGLQRGQHLTHSIWRTMPYRQLAHGCVQRSSERPAQARVRPGLHLSGAPSAVQRLGSQRIEQHRLPYPAQPSQHQAALRSAPFHALQRDVEGGQLSVATGQLRWALAGTRGVRVPHRVHVSERISLYSAILRFR